MKVPIDNALGLCLDWIQAIRFNVMQHKTNHNEHPERVLIPGFMCLRCGYRWVPRTKHRPVTCPGCQTPYWDRPYIRGRKAQYRAKQREGKTGA